MNQISNSLTLKVLPHRTVQRLSKYRRVMMNLLAEHKFYIFSYQLAEMLHITPVQVRNDLMLMGYSASAKKGYDVKELIDRITICIGIEESVRIALIGLGNLGKAILGYISCKKTNHTIVAAFDTDPEKINKLYAGIPCYNISELDNYIKSNEITLAIITTNSDSAQMVAEKLSIAGIKAIINYTSTSLTVNNDVYLEEHDIITSLEKTAYFVKTHKQT